MREVNRVELCIEFVSSLLPLRNLGGHNRIYCHVLAVGQIDRFISHRKPTAEITNNKPCCTASDKRPLRA